MYSIATLLRLNGGPGVHTGPSTWMSSPPENNYDNDVAKITGNVLKRFLDPKPFVDIDHAQVKDVTRIPPNPECEHMDQQ